MARIVQKFGGTSVADLDRIRAVAERVKRAVDAGDQVAVVVSAMAGTTNQLVEWTRGISAMHDAREYDVVVSAGEQITVGLTALALQAIGVDARSWLGWQIPMVTDDVHGRARILDVKYHLLLPKKASIGGGLDYFLNTVFNYPTLAECYKVAAYNAANKIHYVRRLKERRSAVAGQPHVDAGATATAPAEAPAEA